MHDRLWKLPRIRFFLKISPKLEPLQKFILVAIIWIVTPDTSEDALRNDPIITVLKNTLHGNGHKISG